MEGNSTTGTAERRTFIAAWAILAALFAFAFVAHAWGGYRLGLALITAIAVALCFLGERASVVLFIGTSALDAHGFITHAPFSISVARVVVVAATAAMLVRWLREGRPSLGRSMWDLGVAVFFVGAAISVPLSASLPLSAVGIVHLTFLVGAYVLLSRAGRSDAGREVVYTTTVAVGTLSALIALGQEFVPGFPLPVLRQTTTITSELSVRASAFFDNPNTMALLLVLALLFAVGRVWVSPKPLARIAYAVAAVLSFVGIAVSYSRAALVGVLVGGVVLGALLIRRTRDRLAFVVALVALFAVLLAIPGVGARALSIVDFKGDASAMDRVYLSEVSVKMFADHPLTGVGIQAFRAAYPAYADSRVSISPVTDGHQMPFSIPAETGVAGLIAEALLFGALVWLLVRELRRADASPHAPGIAAMVAIAAMSFFNTFVFFESFWIAIALVGAAFLTERDTSDRAEERRIGRPWRFREPRSSTSGAIGWR